MDNMEINIKEFVQEFLSETEWEQYDQLINYQDDTAIHVYTDWDGEVKCSVFDVDNGRLIPTHWIELELQELTNDIWNRTSDNDYGNLFVPTDNNRCFGVYSLPSPWGMGTATHDCNLSKLCWIVFDAL